MPSRAKVGVVATTDRSVVVNVINARRLDGYINDGHIQFDIRPCYASFRCAGKLIEACRCCESRDSLNIRSVGDVAQAYPLVISQINHAGACISPKVVY